MLISAMFIIGGLLVIILSISGDIGDDTTGSIAGTILFITGLIFLRRHKSELAKARPPGASVPRATDPVASMPLDPPVAEPEHVEKKTEITEVESAAVHIEPVEEVKEGSDATHEISDKEASSDRQQPLQDGNFIKVAVVEDVKEGCCTPVEVAGEQIALFNLDGDFYALRDKCSHARANLSDGEVEGNEIVCPLHGATFNITSGEATGPPAYNGVKTYRVRVTGTDIELEV